MHSKYRILPLSFCFGLHIHTRVYYNRFLLLDSKMVYSESSETIFNSSDVSVINALEKATLPVFRRNRFASTLSRRSRLPASSPAESIPAAVADVKGGLGLTTLYEPSDPRIDFIFVHGLHGGSRKTWSLNPGDNSTYWPKEWLPREAGFENVRVHTFGYDSDWSKASRSSLRIRDFSQALLASIYNSPSMKTPDDLPIVLIAHSMGGLVIKQAYLLARNDPVYQNVYKRIHSLYFLATPHRGSNSAVYLKTFLAMSFPSGAKAYANELLPDSQTVADINDDFRHVSGNLCLWSFFESVPTAGFMIVDKSSAVMGLPGEHVQYLSADHRHVCKFRDVEDPNYITVRDCFRTTIQDINKIYAIRQNKQLEMIAAALGMKDHHNIDLLAMSEKLHEGTCEWVTEHKDFQRWLQAGDSPQQDTLGNFPYNSQPRILWLSGPPGSGKSVTTSQVVRHLKSLNKDCCYFFIKKERNFGLTTLLISLACQMAMFNLEARQALFTMAENNDAANTHDQNAMWKALFLGRMFQIDFSRPFYWVIDALDESPKKALVSLVQMLCRIDARIPLSIFITSRPDSPDAPVGQVLDAEGARRFELRTGQEESLREIATFVRSQPRLARMLQHREHDKVVSDILEKSRGIFLWASLVIGRLDELYSAEDIVMTLEQMPSEMNRFYDEIVKRLAASSYSSKAKCILKWIVCAPEPLTTQELMEAVSLDIGHTLFAAASGEIFTEICGGLVTVNSESLVQLMHQSVGDFLVSAESNFFVSPREAHEELANICLSLMNGRGGLRRISKRSKPAPHRSKNALLRNYTCVHFSHHLVHSSSGSKDNISSLEEFIDTKTLIWIENLSKKKKIELFLRTIENIKIYLARKTATALEPDPSIVKIKSWVEDLTHIISIFGDTLMDCPDSIYSFVPPLCPTSTFLYQSFAKGCSPKVICPSNTHWDERLSCWESQSPIKSIAVTERHIATGHTDGMIRICSSSTFEQLAVLKHGGSVRKLAFGNISNVLASCSPKALKVWSKAHQLVWDIPIPAVASSVCFNADDTKLLVTVKNEVKCAMLTFAVADGAQLDPITIPEDDATSESESESESSRHRVKRFCPEVAAVSFSLGLVAITWKSSPLTIFSLDSLDKLEKLCVLKKNGFHNVEICPQILAVEFNPAVESDLVAVAYQDGDIVIFEIDEWEPRQINHHSLHTRTIAITPDGRTLAAADTLGSICLFSFDHALTLLHRIEPLDQVASLLSFSPDSLRLHDIRGRYCNIWQPTVLVRGYFREDGPNDTRMQCLPAARETGGFPAQLSLRTKTISIVEPGKDSEFFFCGREDGSITVHEIQNGNIILELRLHSVNILHMNFDATSSTLLSIDASRRCRLTRVNTASTNAMELSQGICLLDHRAHDSVTHSLIKPGATALLLSNASGEELWNGTEVLNTRISTESSQWMRHPIESEFLILVDSTTVRIYRWDDLQQANEQFVSSMSPQIPPNVSLGALKNKWTSSPGLGILYQVTKADDTPGAVFLTLDLGQSLHQCPSITVSCGIKNMLAAVKVLLGVTRSAMVFLDQAGWICTLSNKNVAEAKSYTRHFYIPPFWRVGEDLQIKIIGRNSLAIPLRDGAVIIHGFMDFSHKVDFLAFPDDDGSQLVKVSGVRGV